MHNDTIRVAPIIPFSCSLSFRQETADDVPCRIHPGFTPAWFRQYMALDYREPWHTDPHLRRDSFAEMGRVLNTQFPELRLGGDPEATPGSIAQIRTTAFIGSLFGLPVEYHADRWPDQRCPMLTDDEVDTLDVPDIAATEAFQDLARQMDAIAADWGRIPGALNYQGVLNTAFRLRGQELFLDMALAPARAHRLLEVVCETMLAVVEAVYARQAASGVAQEFFVTANCVVNMLSSEHYRAFVMPYDRRLAARFRQFGIHNCAWRVDPYAPAYAEVADLAYLDFGFDSDFALLRRLYPRTTLCAMYHPVALAQDTPAQVRRELQRLHDAVGRCRIIVADIEAGTPRERLLEFFAIAAEIWGVAEGRLLV